MNNAANSTDSFYDKKLPGLILRSGALVGTLDILSACIYYYIITHNNPIRIFPFIASGLFGKNAFSGETSMIIAGFVIHYLVAYTFTIIFFLCYPFISRMIKSAVLTGIAYGLFIWCVMNLIVLPLSATPPPTWKPERMIINMIILILAIGMPLSFIARKVRER